MGALNRATVREVSELVASDPTWWPGFCAGIAEKGQLALREERDMRGWSWGALWKWIVSDEKLYGEYMQALEAYAQDKALETVSIADDLDPADVAGVSKGKVQIETRFRLAGKVDRARWGEKVEVSGKVEHRHSLIGILSGMGGEDAEVIEHDSHSRAALAAPSVVSPQIEYSSAQDEI